MDDVQTLKLLKSEEKPRRIRRSRAAARAEILDGARAALEEMPFSELTVDEVMARTGMTRSSFYHYFESLEQVAVELLGRVEDSIREAVDAWLGGELNEPDYRAATVRHLTTMFERIIPERAVMRAAADAANASQEIQAEWQRRVIDSYVDMTAHFIRREILAGRAQVDDPDQLGYALIQMNNAVATDNARRETPLDPATIGRTLGGIWNAAIYGSAA